MSDAANAIRKQLAGEIAHWALAVNALGKLDDLASAPAWGALELYLGASIRKHLAGVVDRLRRETALLLAALDAASSRSELDSVHRRLWAFRRFYVRAETTLDFFADAISTRTSPTIGALLRACDSLAQRSMAQLLDQLGKPTPIVLTYLDKGLGASILKAGLRLWDGTSENPCAAIKIVRHNLLRPTALIHEAGHQVAHITGWNDELAAALQGSLSGAPDGVADAFSGWASEIAADAFAFVHTGYASVAALHDVITGDVASVFRYTLGDPHPISFIRVLLGVEMCRAFYGTGPWDNLANAWMSQYDLANAPYDTATLLRQSLPYLPNVVNITLRAPMRAFHGRALSTWIDPGRVSPTALAELEQRLGRALFTSMHWVWTESLRLLALTGLRTTTTVQKSDLLKEQESWMLRLGGALQAA